MNEGKKILLVDDDEAILRLNRKIVERAGFVALEARDGEEAITMALKEKPALVVLDLTMPKKDGLAVARELRSRDWGKTLPIIILTGKGPSDAQLDDLIKWEPTYYVVKGNESTEDFVAKINEVLEIREH